MGTRKGIDITPDKYTSWGSAPSPGTACRHGRKYPLCLLLAVMSTLFFAGALAGGDDLEPSKEEIEGKHAEALERLSRLHWALETSSLPLALVTSVRLPKSTTSTSSLLYDLLDMSKEDPFNESRDLQWTPFPVEDKLFLWSFGPDKRDDRGLIEYDPTNGIMSPGDVVWIVRDFSDPEYDDTDKIPYYPAAPYFEQDHQQEKLRQFVKDVAYLKAVLSVYINEKKVSPKDLGDLLTMKEIVTRLPSDPYRPSEPYGYRVVASSKEALIYSVGPDGVDNVGVSLIHSASSVPEGDIVARVPLLADAYADKIEEVHDEFLAALMKMREETGEDNALIYYQQGAVLDLPQPDHDALKTTLKNGWSAESEPLLAYFRIYQPAFDLIQKGVALRQATMLDPWDRDLSTPDPSLSFAGTSVKLLCAQGLYFESLGEPEKALENYSTALQMGQDYGCENASLICGLMMVALENRALRHLHSLVFSGELDEPQLAIVSKALQETESGNRPLTDCIESEFKCHDSWLREVAGAAKDDPTAMAAIEPFEGRDQTQMLVNDPDRFLQEIAAAQAKILRYFSTPRWERNSKDWQDNLKELEGKRRYLYQMALNSAEADTRFLVTQSRIRMARAAVALEQFKKAAGHYPENISSLIPEYLPETPVDPFVGSPLCYVKKDDGYQIYGMGPDRSDQEAAVRYDPTNGTMSQGDILY